jgi:hypothetical protein
MDDEWTDDLPWLGQYILDENGEPVPAPGLRQWGQWLQDHQEERILAKDKIGNAEVSTVFLAIDHGAGFLMRNFQGTAAFAGAIKDALHYKPTLWETMVFGGPYDQHLARYTSREDALAGHGKIVQMLTS